MLQRRLERFYLQDEMLADMSKLQAVSFTGGALGGAMALRTMMKLEKVHPILGDSLVE